MMAMTWLQFSFFFTKDLLHHISYWLLPIWCKILWHTFEVFNLNKLSQKTLYIEKLTGIILSRMSLVWTICYRLQNIDFVILSSECWLQDISFKTLRSEHWPQYICSRALIPGHWYQTIECRTLTPISWLQGSESETISEHWHKSIYSSILISGHLL